MDPPNEHGSAPSGSDDKKPEHINIKVKAQDGTEVFFKLKKSTPLRKVMEAYCERQGKQFTAMKFCLDGKRLTPSMSAEEAGLENDDIIDVYLQQEGGSLYFLSW